jgi:hypothetical protein
MQPPERGAAPHAQLCFGQVRHKRLRPVVNAFEYRAYYLRLPVVVDGAAAVAPFGCALFSHNRFNLLSFHDRDHGDGVTPLSEWIGALLRREAVFDADGDLWLQAMPRVLGFVFNPVSFWFCHRADGELRAVIGGAGHGSGHTPGREAAYFGVWNWGVQVTLALAAGIALALLGWCGYLPGLAGGGAAARLLTQKEKP